MGILRPSFIVGIGGSAGALDAYTALLKALPHNTGMTFVIISHMFPTAISQLAGILTGHTKMPVVVASNAMRIRANHVYVIPPNADLRIWKYAFKVISPRAKSNVAVDLFFTSLAKAMGERAIGIILSGYDGDGTEGCKHIKAKGGITFAQDKSAKVPHMPFTAQASGCIDFVMPIDKIADKLISLNNTIQEKKRKEKKRKEKHELLKSRFMKMAGRCLTEVRVLVFTPSTQSRLTTL